MNGRLPNVVETLIPDERSDEPEPGERQSAAAPGSGFDFGVPERGVSVEWYQERVVVLIGTLALMALE